MMKIMNYFKLCFFCSFFNVAGTYCEIISKIGNGAPVTYCRFLLVFYPDRFPFR